MTEHVPVMLERCLALLAPAVSDPGAVVVDATLGLGGHSAALLERAPRSPAGRPRPRHRGTRPLRGAPGAVRDRTTLVHAVYDELPDVLARLGLGQRRRACCSTSGSPRCSSTRPSAASPTPTTPRSTCGWTADARHHGGRGPQHLPGRGPGPGAARSTARSGSPAGSPIGRRPARERGAVHVDPARLADLVRDAIPAATRRTGGNPSKRTFQALRIEVNGELAALQRAIPAAIAALAVGGRIVVHVLPVARGPDRQAGARRWTPSTRAGRTCRCARGPRARGCG